MVFYSFRFLFGFFQFRSQPLHQDTLHQGQEDEKEWRH